ncbi:MAG: tyrosine-protein phosphatase [Acidimicrobiales bacterium]
MPVLSPGRHISCDGAFNIRDIGGYRTTSGRDVRRQAVYRADGLHRVPPAGAHALEHLGWRTVIDLRTTGEVDAGSFAAEGVVVVNLPILRATWGIPDAPVTDPVAFLSSHYLQMLDEGAAAIAASFAILSSPVRLPAVFHCSAGKDRTGVLAALVLSVLGVPDEVVAADYHLSGPAVERLVAWLSAAKPDLSEEMSRQPRSLLSCPPEAMHAFLTALRSRFGSIEGYLTGIGVEARELADLRRIMLEPA